MVLDEYDLQYRICVAEGGGELFEALADQLKVFGIDVADSVKTMIDLGSGNRGTSLTNAIRAGFFPNLEVVTTVDLKFDTTLDVGEDFGYSKHVHQKCQITDFLSKNEDPVDLVSIIGVPETGIRETNEYEDLYRVVKPGGFVYEAWEHSLYDLEMEDVGFVRLPGIDKIWMRPLEEVNPG